MINQQLDRHPEINSLETTYNKCEDVIRNQMNLLKHTFQNIKYVNKSDITGKRTAGISYELPKDYSDESQFVEAYYITKITYKIPLTVQLTKAQLDEINMTMTQEL